MMGELMNVDWDHTAINHITHHAFHSEGGAGPAAKKSSTDGGGDGCSGDDEQSSGDE
jgi:hypothetical protein